MEVSFRLFEDLWRSFRLGVSFLHHLIICLYFYVCVNVCVCVAGGRLNGHSRPERRPETAGYETSSTLMSSELDTTSFFDSEEDDSTSR